MGRISIKESVQKGAIHQVHTYEDLENHHPSYNFNESGRSYAVVDGDREEVLRNRARSGNLLVSKDFILADTSMPGTQPYVPSPASGYIGTVDPRNGVVGIYDKPNGELIVQIRHMDLRNSGLEIGDQVTYGQPLGRQSGFGKGIPDQYRPHVHMDFNEGYIDQFKKYISDIDLGHITTTNYPKSHVNLTNNASVPTSATPLADGVLRQGERGPEITALQTRLNALGFKDDRGNTLVPDGDFGNSTKQAVVAFQRARGLEDDGIVGQDTFTALKQNARVVQPPVPAVTPQTQTGTGTTILSNLIGSGEGDYSSYNRGRAGDASNAINLTDMTVGEIIRRQHLPKSDPDYLFAAGKFQMVGPPADTMSETVRALGISRDAKFTPDLQERMFADYLIDGKRPAINDYITGITSGAAGLERAQHALALEFASVGDPRKSGRGAYDGDSAGNSASISLLESASALNQMRTQYQAGIDRGLSPDAAYDALRGQSPNQNNALSAHNKALADGVLKKGEHGPEIAVLQTQLNALGFKDAKGNALVPDGDFGDRTKQAVEAFQRSRGLVDDGVVGKDTLAALKNAESVSVATTSQQVAPARNDHAPLLSHPNHPDHALYQQALSGIEKLPATTFRNEQERQNAAASVALDAKVSGLSRVDTVALSTNGSGLFAVQGAMSDPAHHRVYVDKGQAENQSVEKSTQQLQQENLLSVQALQTQEHQKKSMAI